MTITTNEYATLDSAYTYFNEKLFEGQLPDCIITMQRKNCRGGQVLGFFHFERFSSRTNQNDKISEIALNPDTYEDRDDMNILSTLGHEMVHLWQYYFSEPCRKSYHDKDWGRKMESIGLMPSNTGEYGGKKTGQRMDHYIVEGGLFESVCNAFLFDGKKKLSWASLPEPKKEKSDKEKKKTRVKYACPECLQNAWAKPEASLMCGDCEVKLIIEEDDAN